MHTTTLSFATPTANKLVTIPAGEDGTVLLHSSGTVATALTLSGALTCSSTVDLSAAQISGTDALVFGGANTGDAHKLTLAVTEPGSQQTVTLSSAATGDILVRATATGTIPLGAIRGR